jgi:hypothetical protein
MERSPRVGAAILPCRQAKQATEQKQLQDAEGQHGEAGEGAARVTVDGGAGRARAVGRPTEQEQMGSPSMCGPERSRSPMSISFPYPAGTT